MSKKHKKRMREKERKQREKAREKRLMEREKNQTITERERGEKTWTDKMKKRCYRNDRTDDTQWRKGQEWKSDLNYCNLPSLFHCHL